MSLLDIIQGLEVGLQVDSPALGASYFKGGFYTRSKYPYVFNKYSGVSLSYGLLGIPEMPFEGTVCFGFSIPIKEIK